MITGIIFKTWHPEVALDLNILCNFDGQSRKNYVIIYYYPSF